MDVMNQNVRQPILVVVDGRAIVGLDLQVGLLLKDGIVVDVVVALRVSDDGSLEEPGPRGW